VEVMMLDLFRRPDMTTAPLIQPYPLWVAECRPGNQPQAFRVVAWHALGGDALDPMVVLQGGDHAPAAAHFMKDPAREAGYAYGDSEAEACQSALKAAAPRARP
jgi:hypothetical protein